MIIFLWRISLAFSKYRLLTRHNREKFSMVTRPTSSWEGGVRAWDYSSSVRISHMFVRKHEWCCFLFEVDVCLGRFTERSYTHTIRYTKVRHSSESVARLPGRVWLRETSSESLTDPMLAKNFIQWERMPPICLPSGTTVLNYLRVQSIYSVGLARQSCSELWGEN